MTVKDADASTHADPPDIAVALREAFLMQYLPLLRLAMLLSHERHSAEDLVQEAFARSATKLSQLGPEEVRPYLRRTVVNLWKNSQRRTILSRRWAGPSLSPTSEAHLEDQDELWQQVLRLPQRQRACLVLRYYEDLTQMEIAEVLGCSTGTVKSQTSKALARLRRELDDER